MAPGYRLAMIASHGITVRTLSEADAEQAAALIRQAFGLQPIQTDPPSSALKETGASIIAQLARGGGGALAEAGGAMVGAVLWEEAEGGLYFGRLAVDPAARGRGVARALVHAVMIEARRRDLPRIHASVRIVLADNRRLFATLGFTETVASAHPGYSLPTTIAIEKWLAA